MDKISKFIALSSLSSLLLTPLITKAVLANEISPMANYSIRSTVNLYSNYMEGSMVSNGPSNAGVWVDSEIVNPTPTVLRYAKSFTYDNKYPAETYVYTSFRGDGYVENGCILNGNWTYVRRTTTIGY